MEEQLISSNTAILAKDKGFPQTLEIGVTCRKSNSINKEYTSTSKITQNDLNNNWCVFNEIYCTQALLQAWLKEKHIDVQPICNYRSNKGRVYNLGITFINSDNKVDTIIIAETNTNIDTMYRYYDSYEKALEVGLFEALKLIK